MIHDPDLTKEIAALRADLRRINARPSAESEFMTIAEVADRLRKSRRTIDRKRAANRWPIPEYDFDGRVMFKRSDVDHYIHNRLAGAWGDA